MKFDDLLPEVPYEKRKLPYEDVFPMLYLKYRLSGGNSTHKNIKHLVIDEMQDYSYLQYTILESLFHCRMTILGDRAQTLDTKQQDVLRFLPKLLGREIRTIEIKRVTGTHWKLPGMRKKSVEYLILSYWTAMEKKS